MDSNLTDPVTITPSSRPPPVREDCWSEEATATLIEAWGRRYLELNRGNLRQKDWQEVADAVNALHGHTKKTHRTDVQCKNRVDTIKKKYKVEKQRVLSSDVAGTRYVSNWRFFDKMDFLIGNKSPKPSPPSPPVGLPLPYKRAAHSSPATAKVVVTPPLKKWAGVDDGGYFRRNYSAMAAAAAAAEAKGMEAEGVEDEDVEEEEEEEEEEKEEGVNGEGGDGFWRLAKAIEGFGNLYERVEVGKLRQLVEVEKRRMQFEKDLELQRMQMFMDTQVQLEKIRRRK